MLYTFLAYVCVRKYTTEHLHTYVYICHIYCEENIIYIIRLMPTVRTYTETNFSTAKPCGMGSFHAFVYR